MKQTDLHSRRFASVRLLAITAAMAAAILAMAGPAAANDKTTTLVGTIESYECGDNCYLTVRDGNNEDVVGLCVAPECNAWNENVEMPESIKGKRVSVTVGTGVQVDGSGNVMGEMMSFEKIEFLD